MKRIQTAAVVVLALIACSCGKPESPVSPPVIIKTMSAKYQVAPCLIAYEDLTETYGCTDGSYTKITSYYFSGDYHVSTASITAYEFNKKVFAPAYIASSSRTFKAETADSLKAFCGFTAPAGAVNFWKTTDDVEIICGDVNGVIVYYGYNLGRDNTRPPGMPPVMDACTASWLLDYDFK